MKNKTTEKMYIFQQFLYSQIKVTMENIEIDFAENPTPEYPAMMAEVEPCTNRGVFINNVKELTLKNVKVHGTAGEPFEIENVDCVEKE